MTWLIFQTKSQMISKSYRNWNRLKSYISHKKYDKKGTQTENSVKEAESEVQ